MFRIFTDNTDTTFSLDNFAFLTDRFYWWSDFHLKSSFPKRLYYVFPDALVEPKQTRPSAIVARTRQEINFFFTFLSKKRINRHRYRLYPINTFFPSKANPYLRICSFVIPSAIKAAS